MKKLFISILLLSICGCSTMRQPATILITKVSDTEDKVTFTSGRKVEMSYKKGDAEAKYNSQAESLFSKIISILTIGAIGSK